MGRYTGPVEKLERREGVDLGLKGTRRLLGKTSLERRGAVPPGQHGAARRGRPSVYSVQLRETQKLKLLYGVRERQFRRYVEQAARRRDVTTGEALLQTLERRLDNVVYRLGLANTRAQARQFVGHGHIWLDGRRCDIASALVAEGSVITLAPGAPVEPVARQAAEEVGTVPPWLQADLDALTGRVLRLPVRDEIHVPVVEQHVVERYARR
ncbi:30S ribosomal protein S4 [Conexibacter sp. W3-3-2]|uniref:Small ribosomal subunit protein uS4 n=1 Tax=Paraconexibacter algicola TaxID=2133960 RepID=A0A2T4UDK8_9ACTN|nr:MULTISPECIES: 30S ribosomal protein S4 [Solirubrobacterales]MTD43820.1 30S ribosomal protein S4 [Conexibacter sp. W3-3-2]PTL55584.1 30S ribosomal protein S4 [Paraconexibacter algicola]